jgi:hypothetical protein
MSDVKTVDQEDKDVAIYRFVPFEKSNIGFPGVTKEKT